MKKIILAIILILLIGCESERDYLSVEILNITTGENAVIVYSFTNNSDFDINAYIEFDLVCKEQKTQTTDCFIYPAKTKGSSMVSINYKVESAQAKIKLCK